MSWARWTALPRDSSPGAGEYVSALKVACCVTQSCDTIGGFHARAPRAHAAIARPNLPAQATG